MTANTGVQMLELAEIANYGAKKLGEIDPQYVTPKMASALNSAIERFWLIARTAKGAAATAPAKGDEPVCAKCNGEGFINRHANLPDEPCPVCAVPSSDRPASSHCWCGLHVTLKNRCDRCMERGVFARPASSQDGVRLEARRADTEKWIEIYPAQVEWMNKAGYQLRASESVAALAQPKQDGVRAALEKALEELANATFAAGLTADNTEAWQSFRRVLDAVGGPAK